MAGRSEGTDDTNNQENIKVKGGMGTGSRKKARKEGTLVGFFLFSRASRGLANPGTLR